MTTTITTAKELYKVSPDFRGFMRCWVRRRRAPLPLADFLREHGLESQAACVEWCALRPELPRDRFSTPVTTSPSYPHPTDTRGKKWWWFPRSRLVESDDVPRENVPDLGFSVTVFPTVTAAFLGLMDAWKESAT